MFQYLSSHPIICQVADSRSQDRRKMLYGAQGFMFEVGPICRECWMDASSVEGEESSFSLFIKPANASDDNDDWDYDNPVSLENFKDLDEYMTCESCNKLMVNHDSLNLEAKLALKWYDVLVKDEGDFNQLRFCVYCREFGMPAASMSTNNGNCYCEKCIERISFVWTFSEYEFEGEKIKNQIDYTLEGVHATEEVVAKEVQGLFENLMQKMHNNEPLFRQELERVISYAKWNNILNQQRRYDEQYSLHNEVKLLEYILKNL